MMTEIERLRVQVDAMEKLIVEQRKQLAGFISGETLPPHISASSFGGLKCTVAAGLKHLKNKLASTPEQSAGTRRLLEGQIAVAKAWDCFLRALCGGAQ